MIHESCSCHFYWESRNQFIVAWGNFIKVVEIHDLHESEKEKAIAAGLPSKAVVVMSQFSTEFPISGLALYDDVLVLLVCYEQVCSSA